MKVTRVHGRADGETTLTEVDLETSRDPANRGLAHLVIPTTTMVYAEYPIDQVEMMPGFHCAPRRQFVLSLQGQFEVTTTTGQSKLFGPGDWLLADDVGSKGHRTKGVGDQPRLNLIIGIDPGWQMPGS